MSGRGKPKTINKKEEREKSTIRDSKVIRTYQVDQLWQTMKNWCAASERASERCAHCFSQTFIRETINTHINATEI